MAKCYENQAFTITSFNAQFGGSFLAIQYGLHS